MAELGSGVRDNQGKLRYDLVNPLAHEGMVDILTYGAIKYEDHNWENGMSWSKVIQSLKRHLAAIEKGEDYDFYPDTCEKCKSGECIIHSGKLHIDHIQCNAHFLAAYYRIYPQGDDRYLLNRPRPKIGLDIDEVICDWVGPWNALWGQKTPTCWSFDWEMTDKFDTMRKLGTLDKFYLSLKPKVDPATIPFEPHAYVTSRPVSSEVTKEWLRLHGFPLTKVITVPVGASKVDAMKQAGIQVFVDDRYENFKELNANGIFCYLFDAPHNRRYEVGHKRIKSLSDIKL